MAKQDDYIKTALRLPRPVHAAVQAEADARGISMNAEIIRRLSGGVDEMSLKKLAEMDAVMAETKDLSQQLEASSRSYAELVERQGVLVKRYKQAITGFSKQVIEFLENVDRTTEDENALLGELVKILAQLQDSDS